MYSITFRKLEHGVQGRLRRAAQPVVPELRHDILDGTPGNTVYVALTRESQCTCQLKRFLKNVIFYSSMNEMKEHQE